jgi:hypothetical protein
VRDDASGHLTVLRHLTRCMRDGTPEVGILAARAVAQLAANCDPFVNDALRKAPGLVRALHGLSKAPRHSSSRVCAPLHHAHSEAAQALAALGAQDAVQGRIEVTPPERLSTTSNDSPSPPLGVPTVVAGRRTTVEGRLAGRRRTAQEGS